MLQRFNRRQVTCIAVVAGLLGITATLASAPSHSAAAPYDRYRVRLYSEGKAVGEWTATGPGKVDGHSFVFMVGEGMSKQTLRISGTYSVEQTR